MASARYPLGYMQYINAADREACCKDDFTKRATFQRYLVDLPNQGFSKSDMEIAGKWLTNVINKLSPAATTC